MTGELLTVREVALILRVSAPTVRRLIAAGELDGWRAGVQVRISADSLERLLTGEGS